MLPVIIAVLLQMASNTGSTPAKLMSAVSPVPPVNAIAGECVLAEVPLNSRGVIGEISILHGTKRFSDSLIQAMKQWKFTPASVGGQAAASKVSVLTIFRPAAFGNEGLGGPSFGYRVPSPPQRNNHAPMPALVGDPGYPRQANATGVVILEVTIDKIGIPSNIRTIQGVSSLTEDTTYAVRKWVFLPAMESGQPVAGTLIVAVSYLQPVVTTN